MGASDPVRAENIWLFNGLSKWTIIKKILAMQFPTPKEPAFSFEIWGRKT
jgi:hypothetical protein